MANVVYDGVSKIFRDGTRAVDQLDLEIPDGEFMVLVGPSGCGKTTALRMLAGLEDVSDGAIRIGDRVVNELSPRSRDIAMVFQSYALYPHLTVYDNIAFARWAGRSSASHRPSSWTNRFRISTRSSVSRCAPTSRSSRATSA
jgi:ABC-type sugar transport system ATPase subunit